ncbi:unnamed protein product [Amoebophrya sp. A120]|nr:unnamed protein product [Amoebophrya sp. A120]|eukprot:GSA120T00016334001.1
MTPDTPTQLARSSTATPPPALFVVNNSVLVGGGSCATAAVLVSAGTSSSTGQSLPAMQPSSTTLQDHISRQVSASNPARSTPGSVTSGEFGMMIPVGGSSGPPGVGGPCGSGGGSSVRVVAGGAGAANSAAQQHHHEQEQHCSRPGGRDSSHSQQAHAWSEILDRLRDPDQELLVPGTAVGAAGSQAVVGSSADSMFHVSTSSVGAQQYRSAAAPPAAGGRQDLVCVPPIPISTTTDQTHLSSEDSSSVPTTCRLTPVPGLNASIQPEDLIPGATAGRRGAAGLAALQSPVVPSPYEDLSQTPHPVDHIPAPEGEGSEAAASAGLPAHRGTYFAGGGATTGSRHTVALQAGGGGGGPGTTRGAGPAAQHNLHDLNSTREIKTKEPCGYFPSFGAPPSSSSTLDGGGAAAGGGDASSCTSSRVVLDRPSFSTSRPHGRPGGASAAGAHSASSTTGGQQQAGSASSSSRPSFSSLNQRSERGGGTRQGAAGATVHSGAGALPAAPRGGRLSSHEPQAQLESQPHSQYGNKQRIIISARRTRAESPASEFSRSHTLEVLEQPVDLLQSQEQDDHDEMDRGCAISISPAPAGGGGGAAATFGAAYRESGEELIDHFPRQPACNDSNDEDEHTREDEQHSDHASRLPDENYARDGPLRQSFPPLCINTTLGIPLGDIPILGMGTSRASNSVQPTPIGVSSSFARQHRQSRRRSSPGARGRHVASEDEKQGSSCASGSPRRVDHLATEGVLPASKDHHFAQHLDHDQNPEHHHFDRRGPGAAGATVESPAPAGTTGRSYCKNRCGRRSQEVEEHLQRSPPAPHPLVHQLGAAYQKFRSTTPPRAVGAASSSSSCGGTTRTTSDHRRGSTRLLRRSNTSPLDAAGNQDHSTSSTAGPAEQAASWEQGILELIRAEAEDHNSYNAPRATSHPHGHGGEPEPTDHDHVLARTGRRTTSPQRSLTFDSRRKLRRDDRTDRAQHYLPELQIRDPSMGRRPRQQTQAISCPPEETPEREETESSHSVLQQPQESALPLIAPVPRPGIVHLGELRSLSAGTNYLYGFGSSPDDHVEGSYTAPVDQFLAANQGAVTPDHLVGAGGASILSAPGGVVGDGVSGGAGGQVHLLSPQQYYSCHEVDLNYPHEDSRPTPGPNWNSTLASLAALSVAGPAEQNVPSSTSSGPQQHRGHQPASSSYHELVPAGAGMLPLHVNPWGLGLSATSPAGARGFVPSGGQQEAPASRINRRRNSSCSRPPFEDLPPHKPVARQAEVDAAHQPPSTRGPGGPVEHEAGSMLLAAHEDQHAAPLALAPGDTSSGAPSCEPEPRSWPGSVAVSSAAGDSN